MGSRPATARPSSLVGRCPERLGCGAGHATPGLGAADHPGGAGLGGHLRLRQRCVVRAGTAAGMGLRDRGAGREPRPADPGLSASVGRALGGSAARRSCQRGPATAQLQRACLCGFPRGGRAQCGLRAGPHCRRAHAACAGVRRPGADPPGAGGAAQPRRADAR